MYLGNRTRRAWCCSSCFPAQQSPTARTRLTSCFRTTCLFYRDLGLTCPLQLSSMAGWLADWLAIPSRPRGIIPPAGPWEKVLSARIADSFISFCRSFIPSINSRNSAGQTDRQTQSQSNLHRSAKPARNAYDPTTRRYMAICEGPWWEHIGNICAKLGSREERLARIDLGRAPKTRRRAGRRLIIIIVIITWWCARCSVLAWLEFEEFFVLSIPGKTRAFRIRLNCFRLGNEMQKPGGESRDFLPMVEQFERCFRFTRCVPEWRREASSLCFWTWIGRSNIFNYVSLNRWLSLQLQLKANISWPSEQIRGLKINCSKVLIMHNAYKC